MSLVEIGIIVVTVLLVCGALFNLVAALGIVRFPDIYMRSHASTKATTMGVLFILIGTFLFFWIDVGQISVRLLLGILFVFMTAPIGGHLIGRAAYRSGVRFGDGSEHDDLKNYIKNK